MIGKTIDIYSNIYEIVDINNYKICLQSINDDGHMKLSYREFYELIKNKIEEIDKILDYEEISDDECQNLCFKAKYLTTLLGEFENATQFNNVKEIKPNEWTVNFLKSFGSVPTTRGISLRQYETFRRFNNGDSFKYNGLRYDFNKSYSGNYALLVISKLLIE